jgi:spermidine synthase
MQSKQSVNHIPLYKRLFSYVYPVRIRREQGDVNEQMEVLLYRNRLRLAATNALYSDDIRYRPAIIAVDRISHELPNVKSVLLLGSGLGSLVKVMLRKGYAPHFTLVEYDKVVLRWALEFLQPDVVQIDAICADAADFMEKNTTTYDFIFVDIFNDMEVPSFVTTQHFLRLCRRSLSPGGYLALNYIANDADEWRTTMQNMQAVFPGNELVTDGVNRVFIAAVK